MLIVHPSGADIDDVSRAGAVVSRHRLCVNTSEIRWHPASISAGTSCRYHLVRRSSCVGGFAVCRQAAGPVRLWFGFRLAALPWVPPGGVTAADCDGSASYRQNCCVDDRRIVTQLEIERAIGARDIQGLLSPKPSGTVTAFANCASAPTCCSKNRFVPTSAHNGAPAAHFNCCSCGTRTKVARGCQSPCTPSSLIGRKRRGPNAEPPNAFAGSSVTKAVLLSCKTMPPSSNPQDRGETTSVLAISIF